MLGSIRALQAWERVFGIVLVVLAVPVSVRLQSVTLALRERELRSRWASNLRDVVNLLAASVFFGAYLLCGLPFAAALLAAGSVTVGLDLARHGGRTPAARARFCLFVGLALSLPVALFAPFFLEIANRALEVLFAGVRIGG